MPGVKHRGQNTWVESLIEDRESLAAVPAPDGQLPSGQKGASHHWATDSFGPIQCDFNRRSRMPDPGNHPGNDASASSFAVYNRFDGADLDYSPGLRDLAVACS